MRTSTKSYLWPLAVAAAGLLLSARFLAGGYLYTQDAVPHVYWAQQFLKSMASGVAYPQWVMESNFGAGSPSFVFYPPFIFYTYALFGLFTDNVPRIMQCSSALALVCSGLAMYAYARMFLDRPSAFITSVIYMAMPYHLLDIYLRSAIAEFWAFAWMPLVFYAAHRCSTQKSTRSVAALAITYAGLMLTHLLTAALVTAFIVAYAIVFSERAGRVRALIMTASGLALGAMLSGVFLIPALMEQGYVSLGTAKGEWWSVYNNFLFSQKSGDWWFNIFLDITAAVALASAALMLVRYLLEDKHARSRMRLLIFSAISIAAAFFMMTGLSAPIWSILGPLRKAEFPWRLLSPVSLFAAASLGLMLSPELRRCKTMLAAIAVVLVLSAVLSLRIIAGYNGLTPPAGFRYTPDMPYEEFRRNTLLFSAENQLTLDDPYYLPPSAGGNVHIGASVGAMEAQGRDMGFLKNGNGTLTVHRWVPQDRIISVHAASADRLVLRLYAYPNWKAYINGRGAQPLTEPDGLLAVDLQAGDSTVEVRYEGGPHRTAGTACSVLALLGVVLVWRRRSAQQPRAGHDDESSP